jgi:hypothetical protein
MLETNPLPTNFLAIAAAIWILFMAWRGWRLGIVRQTLNILAVGAAYGGGWYGGAFLLPILRPLGFPDRILAIIGGAIVGLATYCAISGLSALLFKRTSQQSVGMVRFGFGVSGALLGAAFGGFLLLVMAVAIRLLGSVAEASAAQADATHHPNRLVTSLTGLKHSIEQGTTGAIIERVDPVPEKVYDTLGKVGRLTAHPESLTRFSEDNHVRSLSAHPKILALRDDPEVAKAVREQDFLTLLRHPKIVAAANDPEVLKLMGGFDLEKALDFALQNQEKPAVR